MDHTVRPPAELVEKWRKLNPLRAGDYIEYDGRIFIATMFDVCPFGTDVFTGDRNVAIMGEYRRYVPERLTAKEIIDMHEYVKANEPR